MERTNGNECDPFDGELPGELDPEMDAYFAQQAYEVREELMNATEEQLRDTFPESFNVMREFSNDWTSRSEFAEPGFGSAMVLYDDAVRRGLL